MSSVTVISKERITTIIDPHKEKIRENLINATVITLSRQPKDVIVDFQIWGTPEPENAPDVLIRAETSSHRRYLLKPWGQSLLDSWQNTTKSLNLELPSPIRIAIKPYVIDSEWLEETE